jgi:ZIP family zinc transporter
MANPVLIAFLITALAGLSTGIGSLIGYFIKKPKVAYLSFALGLSGGVMVYVSFVELLPLAFEDIGELWGIGVFFLGIVFMFIIDQFIPDVENPHHIVKTIEACEEDEEIQELVHSHSNGRKKKSKESQEIPKISETGRKSLMRTGIITALAIGIHNFPEGLATFGTALTDPSLGIVIAVAIAIHNIPEGISVSIPIYYATGSKKKAFWYSFLSGVAEPLGALLGFAILSTFLSGPLAGKIISGLLGFIAGVMVYISFDEILPTAQKYDSHGHIMITGAVLGMAIMALSLLLL